jgi:lysine-N-methylase
MSKPVPVHLPVFQRFDCHNCTYCCRNLVVNVGDDDRQRIRDAGWEARMPGVQLFVEYRFGRGNRYRLARRPDGACVFLGADNLCRLHAESGAAVKPLACRAYPFVPTPGAGGVRLDLRMDCPSAAANQGRGLSAHAQQISQLAREADLTEGMPLLPGWGRGRPLEIDEFLAVTAAFERILDSRGESLQFRLRAGCELLNYLYAARIDKVRGARFVELMGLLGTAALEEARAAGAEPRLTHRAGKLFRQWLFLHAVADDPDTLAKGRLARLAGSWRRYGYARRFAREAGPVPRMRPEWAETTFEAVRAVAAPADEVWEPLERSLRLKLDAHAFAGAGYLGYDVLGGLTALWLLPAVIAWLARMSAVGRGAARLSREDVIGGIRQAHYTFGVSPLFVSVSERLRLKGLARPGIPAAILAAYGPGRPFPAGDDNPPVSA